LLAKLFRTGLITRRVPSKGFKVYPTSILLSQVQRSARTIYFFSRSGEVFVYTTGPEFKLLGQNRFALDGGDFSSTPAISDGQLFIRSSKYLYCVVDSARRQGPSN
jgi:hypothetical protein